MAISPDRDLWSRFAATMPATRAIHVLAEMKNYPPLQTLDIRLRQIRPDLLLIDLATDLDKAAEIIEFIAAFRPPIFVIGLHHHNDPDAILRSLRAGASEFWYSPFEIDLQREAIAKLSRARQPKPEQPSDRGKIIAFASTKPGSGASTIAAHAASALVKATSKRVLLADFDLWSGSTSFFFKVNHWYSLADALAQLERGQAPDWASLVVNVEGLDLLPAPDVPKPVTLESERIQDFLEYTRSLYDYVLIDLPSVFDKVSLTTLSSCDDAFLVTTAEMPSLHLTRKAVHYLTQSGYGQERYRVLVNRLGARDAISSDDMARIFGASVYRSFPSDYLSLHKGLTVNQPLGPRSPLGRNIEEFAGQLSGKLPSPPRRPGLLN